MPGDDNTNQRPGTGNGRWRGTVEADLKNIIRLIEHSGGNIGKLFDAIHNLAQRTTAAETKVEVLQTSVDKLTNGDRRGSILSGGVTGLVTGGGSGICAWKIFEFLFG